MPKISEAQRLERRQHILDAALRCFSRDGFHNTTTADIVRESGVSQGSLYLYFASKEEMIVALAADRHEQAAFVSALAQDREDALEGLMTLIHLHGQDLTSPARNDARRVGVQGWAEALRSPAIRASLVEGLANVREGIVRLIERGQHSSQFRAGIDPEAIARTLIATFQGLMLQVAWGEAVDLAACGQVLRAMIVESLLTPSTQAAPVQ